MISVSQRHRSILDRWERIHCSFSALAGVAAALVMGCAHGNPQPSGVSTEPRDYAIQNSTSCFARIHSINFDGTGSQVLADVRPGQQVEVTLAPGLRLFINMHRISHMNAYDNRQLRRATDFDLVSYGEHCWKSGRVLVRQVEARVS